MGGVVSSSKLTTLLELLKEEPCPLTHPVWQNITIEDIVDLQMSLTQATDLIEISRTRPDNFNSLVRVCVDVFSKASIISDAEKSQDWNYIPVCSFLCLLLSISGTPQKVSPWYQRAMYSDVVPIATLIQSLQRLLRLNDPPAMLLQESALDLRITYIKTLLFIFHAPAFGGVKMQDPTPYAQSLEGFQSNALLTALFEIIPLIITNPKPKQNLLFLKAMMTLAVPCMYTCNAWKLDGMKMETIHQAFAITFELTNPSAWKTTVDRIHSVAEQFVSLLYVVIERCPAFLTYIVEHGYSNGYIAALLSLFQHRIDCGKFSFFHSITLLILSQITAKFPALIALNEPFTSNFNSKMRPHRGTYADLLIEIVTNPMVTDFPTAAPLAPLCCGLIANISSTSARLSCFSCNRIYIFLKKFFAAKVAGRSDFSSAVERLLIAIYQVLRFQTMGSVPMFMFSIDSKKLLRAIAKSKFENWVTYAEKILAFVKVGEKSLCLAKESERMTALQNGVVEIVDPKDEPLKQTEFAMTKEIEGIWYDWFRILFWSTFTEDAQAAGLSFSSFEMPKQDASPVREEPPVEPSTPAPAKPAPPAPEEEVQKPRLVRKKTLEDDFDLADLEGFIGDVNANDAANAMKLDNSDDEQEKKTVDEEEIVFEIPNPVQVQKPAPVRESSESDQDDSDPISLEDWKRPAKAFVPTDHPFGSDDELMNFLDG